MVTAEEDSARRISSRERVVSGGAVIAHCFDVTSVMHALLNTYSSHM